MKRIFDNILPLVIASFAFTSYMVLYQPSFKSSDFFNAYLVFFTAVIWSALILLLEKKQYFLFCFYTGVSCAFIIIGMGFYQFSPEDLTVYKLLLGLVAVLILFLIMFVKIYKNRN